MKRKSFLPALPILAVLVFGVGAGAMAQDPGCIRFNGVINDYSPQAVKPMGPWEIRGPWSLKLKGDSGTADFSAALTMELSDFTQNASNVNTPGARMQHTHHLAVQDGVVTPLANGGFEVTGPVTITKDGNPAPLSASTLVIDITGGTNVQYSNITLTFQGDPATGATLHFGPQAIHGVVRRVKTQDSDGSQ